MRVTHGDVGHDCNPEALTAIGVLVHRLWWARPHLIPSLLSQRPSRRLPCHLLAQPQRTLDGTGTLEPWGRRPEAKVSRLSTCLSCWFWHSALFSRSTALCVCGIYALSCGLRLSPFLETCLALLKNWGAPFSCLAAS